MLQNNTLEKSIRQEISSHGGFMRFDHFMARALYDPIHGYYETSTVFGHQGDFITAGDLGPWLALGLTDLIEQAWKKLGKPASWVLMEQGGGTGRLLCNVLGYLRQRELPEPAQIMAIERSKCMRRRQQALFAEYGFSVSQYSDPAEIQPIENCILFSNELPDAFPVRRFFWNGEQILEVGVGVNERGLCWQCQDAPCEDPPDIAGHLMAAWPEGYVSEWNPSLLPWQKALSQCIQRGFVLTLDYGYAQTEYYRPDRIQGTLLTYQKHKAEDAALQNPGTRDITAHVDFTALMHAGVEYELFPVSWISQGGWLAQSPAVQREVRCRSARQNSEDLRYLSDLKRLLMPFGMGEIFKLFIQKKGLDTDIHGFFDRFDRISALYDSA